ncbi:hypothetical protein [Neobacillus cucumis]|uniref:hypothetical protein n=1 Tax=Neobacillus cucumis TaxID=1740721 RepID=UPI0015E0C276|nr:hypothetical protein [Neobacillus cucumis]
MEKQNKFPVPMNDMGEPTEMNPVNESKAPMVEVNQSVETQDPVEIRDHASVTVI